VLNADNNHFFVDKNVKSIVRFLLDGRGRKGASAFTGYRMVPDPWLVAGRSRSQASWGNTSCTQAKQNA